MMAFYFGFWILDFGLKTKSRQNQVLVFNPKSKIKRHHSYFFERNQ